ncbi:MAG: hypothetical protein GYA17_03345 [Chloroflexi bacterium]|nr:hypothetical protein [Chloroflexota bacterium]
MLPFVTTVSLSPPAAAAPASSSPAAHTSAAGRSSFEDVLDARIHDQADSDRDELETGSAAASQVAAAQATRPNAADEAPPTGDAQATPAAQATQAVADAGAQAPDGTAAATQAAQAGTAAQVVAGDAAGTAAAIAADVPAGEAAPDAPTAQTTVVDPVDVPQAAPTQPDEALQALTQAVDATIPEPTPADIAASAAAASLAPEETATPILPAETPEAATATTTATAGATADPAAEITPAALQPAADTGQQSAAGDATGDSPPETEAKAGAQSPGTEAPKTTAASHVVAQIENDAGSSATQSISTPTEPARLAEAQRTEIINQISQNITTLAKAGNSTLRIQLYPEELGKIDLRVTATSSGVGITLTADQSVTGKLLENQINQLRQSLDQAGVNLSSLNVSTGGGQSRQAWQQSANGNRFFAHNFLSSFPQEDSSAVLPSLQGAASGIDYRI